MDVILPLRTRKIALKIDSFKVLSLKHIVSSTSELNELLAKSEQVSKLKDPNKEELTKILGPGKLLDSLVALSAPAPEAPKADAPAEAGDPDKMFEKAAGGAKGK